MFTHCLLGLDATYSMLFLGNTATNFVDSLKIGNDIHYNNLVIYARAISVLQSSGIGKSHLLTDVSLYSIGRHYLTSFLLGWQIHAHAAHLSLPSKWSRLPAVWQSCLLLFCTANNRQQHELCYTFYYCIFSCGSTQDHVRADLESTIREWLWCI